MAQIIDLVIDCGGTLVKGDFVLQPQQANQSIIMIDDYGSDHRFGHQFWWGPCEGDSVRSSQVNRLMIMIRTGGV